MVRGRSLNCRDGSTVHFRLLRTLLLRKRQELANKTRGRAGARA